VEALRLLVAELTKEETVHRACGRDESHAITTPNNVGPSDKTRFDRTRFNTSPFDTNPFDTIPSDSITTTMTEAMESATQKNKVGQDDESRAESQEVQTFTKETLFYVQFSESCPIFMKQPSDVTKVNVIIHCVLHAQVRIDVVSSAPSFRTTHQVLVSTFRPSFLSFLIES
jgi:hypothetical protein